MANQRSQGETIHKPRRAAHPLPASDGGPDTPDEAVFTVGPPQPVTDSRELPAVNAEDEAGFVSGADLGYAHPDNLPAELDDPDLEPLGSEILGTLSDDSEKSDGSETEGS